MVKFSKKSFLIIVVVAILALSIIAGGIAYAQWDKTSQILEEFNVAISDNTVLSIETAMTNSQLQLLPDGAIIDESRETYKLKIADFTATITGDGNDNDYEIQWKYTSCKNAAGNDTTDYRDLFNILIYVEDDETNPWVADTYRTTDKVVNYHVFITMNDPEKKSFNNETIMGQKFAFEITVDIRLKDTENV